MALAEDRRRGGGELQDPRPGCLSGLPRNPGHGRPGRGPPGRRVDRRRRCPDGQAGRKPARTDHHPGEQRRDHPPAAHPRDHRAGLGRGAGRKTRRSCKVGSERGSKPLRASAMLWACPTDPPPPAASALHPPGWSSACWSWRGRSGFRSGMGGAPDESVDNVEGMENDALAGTSHMRKETGVGVVGIWQNREANQSGRHRRPFQPVEGAFRGLAESEKKLTNQL